MSELIKTQNDLKLTTVGKPASIFDKASIKSDFDTSDSFSCHAEQSNSAADLARFSKTPPIERPINHFENENVLPTHIYNNMSLQPKSSNIFMFVTAINGKDKTGDICTGSILVSKLISDELNLKMQNDDLLVENALLKKKYVQPVLDSF